MDKKVVDSNLTYYDVNKQLMQHERSLDPIELNFKIIDIRKTLVNKKLIPGYLMLLCNDRKDYTIFEFSSNHINLTNFENDLKACLLNRGTVLTITPTEDGAWEIWLRDPQTEENFCYYLFDYSNAVLVY